MTEKLEQKPAFPSEYSGMEKDELGMPIIAHRKYYGMSKRFYAACAAMQGMMSNPDWNVLKGTVTGNVNSYAFNTTKMVKNAYSIADELLKQENEAKI